MNRTMTAVATCLLLTSAAFGEDADAETRFHRAYEQEVVEGKVADAARVYLEMMRDEKVPERLRQEAKFRFAVTTVLLGRSDEARAYLAELVRDPRTPETLRARAAEYLDVAKGIGVGGELDKKLQALVFDLGRASAGDSTVPPVYRDFEIIGRPAVPFLRQLLQHSDPSLRRHAYQLLLRLREPGMGELWKPELGGTYGAYRDLKPYVKASPAEGAALEPRVLAADDQTLNGFLNFSVPVSVEFLRTAVTRKAAPEVLVQHALGSEGAAFDALLLEWMKSDTPALASAAALGVAKWAAKRPADWRPDPALFTAVAERLVATDTSWAPTDYRRGQGYTGADSYNGFLRLAAAVDVGTLLDTMDAAVTRIGAATDDAKAIQAGAVADALADAIDAKVPSGTDAARYVATLRKWAAQPRAKMRGDFTTAMAGHIAYALRTLPQADAEQLAVWAVTDVLRGNASASTVAIPADRATDLPIVLAAFRAADRDTRIGLMTSIGLTGGNPPASAPTREYAHAVLAALPELTRGAVESNWMLPFASFPQLALLVPADEARERLAAVLAAGSALRDRNNRDTGLGWILATTRVGDGVDAVRYHAEVVVPSLEAVFLAVHAQDRPRVLLQAFNLLDTSGPGPDVQRTIADFILAHLEDLASDAGPPLAARPALFPLTVWVPKVKPFVAQQAGGAVTADAADAAVREMTRDPAAVNESILAFLDSKCSPAMRAETFDRLLRTAPADRLPVILRQTANVTCDPASPAALEDALGRAVAAETPDLDVVAKLATAVRVSRPSEKLAPAVPLLLKGNQTQILAGIDAAWSMGREEMVPLLQPLLDSMDPAVRKKARDAIDSIRETRKLKGDR